MYAPGPLEKLPKSAMGQISKWSNWGNQRARLGSKTCSGENSPTGTPPDGLLSLGALGAVSSQALVHKAILADLNQVTRFKVVVNVRQVGKIV